MAARNRHADKTIDDKQDRCLVSGVYRVVSVSLCAPAIHPLAIHGLRSNVFELFDFIDAYALCRNIPKFIFKSNSFLLGIKRKVNEHESSRTVNAFGQL